MSSIKNSSKKRHPRIPPVVCSLIDHTVSTTVHLSTEPCVCSEAKYANRVLQPNLIGPIILNHSAYPLPDGESRTQEGRQKSNFHQFRIQNVRLFVRRQQSDLLILWQLYLSKVHHAKSGKIKEMEQD